MQSDKYYMQQALKLAEEAALDGEVPVGCVIVADGEIIAAERNRREKAKDATAHAEVVAIRAAGKMRPSWRLDECTLYVTLEPCLMCSGAIIHARVKRVVFGAYDPKGGMAGSVSNVFTLPTNHRVVLCGGILEDECSELLKKFFRERR